MSDTNTNTSPTSTTPATDPVEVNLIEAEPVADTQPEGEPEVEPEIDPSDNSGSESESEAESDFETIDLVESELYQVLSLFLSRTPSEDAEADEPTENITDVLAGLKESVDTLNSLLQNAVTTMAATASQQKSSSSSLRRHRTSTKSSKH